MRSLLIILFIISLRSFNVFAQNPLDSIEIGKKKQLLEFGRLTTTDLFAQRIINVFRETFDKNQRHIAEGFYTIPDNGADAANRRLSRVPMRVMNSLNKADFSLYMLVCYAKRFNDEELKEINRIFKTKEGKAATQFKKSLLLDSNYKDANYDVNKIYAHTTTSDAFYKYMLIEDEIVLDFLPMLFKYIEEKRAQDVSQNNKR